MTDFFPPFDHWDGFIDHLNTVIDLERSARETGALVRSRKVTDAQTLLRLALLYGPCGFSLRSTSAWAASVGIVSLSDVGVLKRLRNSATWLETICRKLLSDRVDMPSVQRPIVSLVDGTTIMGPGNNGEEWRLHCRYGASGHFQAIEITDKHFALEAGDIVIGDRIYARPGGLTHVLDCGADFIVRTGWRAFSFTSTNGDAFDLMDTLKKVSPGHTADIELAIRTQGGLLPVRLILQAKDEKAKAAEIKRIKRKANRNQRTWDPRSLEAAGFLIVVTSLDAEICPADEIQALYRTSGK